MGKYKILGGIRYLILGSTITREGIKIISKSYTTPKGKVFIKNGIVTHPDGSKTGDY